MNESNYQIVFMPGIRPKPPADIQTTQLSRCLAASLERTGAATAEATAITANLRVIGWSHQFYGEHGDISIDMPGIEHLIAGRGDVVADRREARSPARRINGVLYGISDRFPALTQWFGTERMKSRVDEIHQYFADQGGRAAAARSMLAGALQAAWNRNQRVMLIGHSFGSVVAYDTLWELSQMQDNRGKVDLFVSMGSPLTMRYLRRRLKGAHYPRNRRYPANIRHWVNLAAVGEATALDRKLSICFAEMLRLGFVDSIDDNLALINQFRGPDGLNVHKCYGYMASSEVGRLVLDWCREADATGDQQLAG